MVLVGMMSSARSTVGKNLETVNRDYYVVVCMFMHSTINISSISIIVRAASQMTGLDSTSGVTVWPPPRWSTGAGTVLVCVCIYMYVYM